MDIAFAGGDGRLDPTIADMEINSVIDSESRAEVRSGNALKFGNMKERSVGGP